MFNELTNPSVLNISTNIQILLRSLAPITYVFLNRSLTYKIQLVKEGICIRNVNTISANEDY